MLKNDGKHLRSLLDIDLVLVRLRTTFENFLFAIHICGSPKVVKFMKNHAKNCLFEEGQLLVLLSNIYGNVFASTYCDRGHFGCMGLLGVLGILYY